MNINYTARNCEFTDEMKEYFEKKMKKVKFYFNHILNVNVIVSFERSIYNIEVKIPADHSTFFAEGSSSSWNEAIDIVSDKIEKEIKKKKDKITDHHTGS
ncbi:MAG: ribosome hibernation-promoting factor, HPF/YfiA family [Brevinematia bacterium]